MIGTIFTLLLSTAAQFTELPARPPIRPRNWSLLTRVEIDANGSVADCTASGIGTAPDLILNTCRFMREMPSEFIDQYRSGHQAGAIVLVFEMIYEFDGQGELPRFSELDGFGRTKREVHRVKIDAGGKPTDCSAIEDEGDGFLPWPVPCMDGTRYHPTLDASGKPKQILATYTLLLATDARLLARSRKR